MPNPWLYPQQSQSKLLHLLPLVFGHRGNLVPSKHWSNLERVQSSQGAQMAAGGLGQAGPRCWATSFICCLGDSPSEGGCVRSVCLGVASLFSTSWLEPPPPWQTASCTHLRLPKHARTLSCLISCFLPDPHQRHSCSTTPNCQIL